MSLMPCPECAQQISTLANHCPHCGFLTRQRPQADDGGVVATVIPYKNVAALVAYYCAVFGLIPGFGLILAPAGLICGIFGLRKRLREPRVKGLAHALVGLILGGLVTVGYAVLIFLMVTGRFR